MLFKKIMRWKCRIPDMYKKRIKMYKQKIGFYISKNSIWYRNSITTSSICMYLDTVKYSITKSVRWLGKISSRCLYFIDNPFKVVVFGRIYCRKSICLFKHVVFVSFFAIFVTKGQTAFNHITAQNKR